MPPREDDRCEKATETETGRTPETRDDETIFVFCQQCNAQVLADVLATHPKVSPVNRTFTSFSEDAHYDVVIYKFSVCPRCDFPFLTMSQSYEVPGEFVVPQGETLLYPVERPFNTDGIPPPAVQAYDQANRSYHAGLYEPSVIMCRKCLEVICQSFGVESGNLKKKLNALANNGMINSKLADWATGVRLVGNEGAHGIEAQVEKEDAHDALEFTEALLSYVFTLSKRFSEFQSRREARQRST